jgi:cell division cycle 14
MAQQQKVPGEIEFGLGRLFWVCMRHVPLDTEDSSFFSTDDVLVYDPYYGDFGPLNIAQICRYCRMLSHKLNDPQLQGKRIYHVCKPQTDTRANSILLCSAWALVCNGKKPQEAYAPFVNVKPALVPYRDASLGPPSYPITVQHCLGGLAKAIQIGWYVHDSFNPDEYEHYERVENGDFNWIVPGKFLAFSGPTQTPIAYVDGVKTNTPETYYEYFRANNVTGVVRFNNKVYDRKKFLDAGFNHYDLYFADGGNPTDAILKKFLEIAESEKGALAIHCKAGLGRTGTLISLYLMKHVGVTTTEVISWLRLCRPGSVIGPQQNFLQEMEKRMHREGDAWRKQHGGAGAPAAAGSSDGLGMEGLSVASSNGSRDRPAAKAAPASPNMRAPATKGFGMATGAPAASRTPASPTRAPASPGVKGKVGSLLKR